MPTLDSCHPQVVRALQNAGWIVAPVPAFIRAGERTVFIDILAERSGNGAEASVLLVEVKCFADSKTTTTDLYTAIGQYLVYRAMLERASVTTPLYLAVPDHAYTELFDTVIQEVVNTCKIRIVTVNLKTETISQWIE